MDTEHPDLAHINARLNQAVVHAANINSILSEWKQTHGTASVVAEYDEGAAEVVLKLADDPEFPGILVGLAFSDIVHCVRSALDNLWYSLMLGFGDTNPHGHFPACTNQQNWDALCSNVEQFWPDRFKAKLLEWQPFHAAPTRTDTHPVRMMTSISNKDKHRAIRAVIPGPTMLEIRYQRSAMEHERVLFYQVVGPDRVFATIPIESVDFDISQIAFSDPVLLTPSIEVPLEDGGRNFFAAGGRSGVVSLIHQTAVAISADLAPFLRGPGAANFQSEVGVPGETTWERQLEVQTMDIGGD